MNKIKLVILDVDGVLTDGTKLYDVNGNIIGKNFNDKDFTAIKRFKSIGVNVCFLSGDENVNKNIAFKRNIDFYYSRNENGSLSKSSFIPFLFEKYSSDINSTIFIGDDLFDQDIIKKLKYTYCPNDAIDDIKNKCWGTLLNKGGHGVISELYSLLIQEHLIEEQTSSYDDTVLLDRIESKTSLKA